MAASGRPRQADGVDLPVEEPKHVWCLDNKGRVKYVEVCVQHLEKWRKSTVGGTQAVRFNRKMTLATRKTSYKNYFRLKDAILENGRIRRIRTLWLPHNPKLLKIRDSDAKNALGKLLLVQGRHLGKWRILTDSASGGPRQSDSIEKSCRRPREGSHMLRA